MVSPEMAASSSTKAVKSIAVIATSGIGPYAASTLGWLGRPGQAHRYSKSSLPLARKTRNGQVLSNRTSKHKPMILLTYFKTAS
jgi:hypothetical protein